MTKTQPVGNYVLVEITDQYANIARDDGDSAHNVGIVRAWSLNKYHITAAAALEFSDAFIVQKTNELKALVGCTVRWEELAETGQMFDDDADNKKYALIPWWRLIAVEPAPMSSTI